MKLPIGYNNFGKVAKAWDFVDKSLFIKEAIDEPAEVAVIICPRRFGKTFNLSMLHHFLAAEVYGKSTQGLFDSLNIAKAENHYWQAQGKYPVIFVSFKEVKDIHFQGAYAKLSKLMSKVYSEHRDLLTSSSLSAQEKESFELIQKQKGSETDVATALEDLTRYLAHHHQVNPWVLIDEKHPFNYAQ